MLEEKTNGPYSKTDALRKAGGTLIYKTPKEEGIAYEEYNEKFKHIQLL
jgi:hypothetical protein